MTGQLLSEQCSHLDAMETIKHYDILKKLYPYSADRIVSEMRMDGGACEHLDWEEIWERLNILIQQDEQFKEAFAYEPSDKKRAKPLIISVLKTAFQEEYPSGSGTGRSIEEMLSLL